MRRIFIFLIGLSPLFYSLGGIEGEVRGEKGDASFIHSGILITEEEFNHLALSTAEPFSKNIVQGREDFLNLVYTIITESPTDLLILVDKRNPLPADYEPNDLILLDSYQELSLSRGGHRLRAVVMPDLLRMVNDAKREGVELLISSCYRSYSYQEGLFNRYASQYGKERANRFSARAGESQHQLGTVIDFGSITNKFAATKAGRWIGDNGHSYGFSLSYPEGYEDTTGYQYESWHYRYLSPPAVELQRRYFNNIQHFFLEFWEENRAFFYEKAKLEPPSL